jgi:hypothetical protein
LLERLGIHSKPNINEKRPRELNHRGNTDLGHYLLTKDVDEPETPR